MKVKSYTFDPEADAAYCYLGDAKVAETTEVGTGIIVDWSSEGAPVGVEVLNVSGRLRGAELGSFLAGLVEGLFARPLAAE